MTASRKGVRKMGCVTTWKRGVTRKIKPTNTVATTPVAAATKEEMMTVSKALWEAMHTRMEEEKKLRVAMRRQIDSFKYYYEARIRDIIQGIDDLKKELKTDHDGCVEKIKDYERDNNIVV